MDNVVFPKENTNEAYETWKIEALAAPKIDLRTINKEKQTKNKTKQTFFASISGAVILESKETKTTNKQKSLYSKYFLQSSAVGFDLSIADG